MKGQGEALERVNDLRGKGGSAASLRAGEARQLSGENVRKKERGLYPGGVTEAARATGPEGEG